MVQKVLALPDMMLVMSRVNKKKILINLDLFYFCQMVLLTKRYLKINWSICIMLRMLFRTQSLPELKRRQRR